MKYQRRMQPWLGTFVEIGVEIGVVAGPAASRSIDAAFAAIAEVHRLMSYHDQASDLSRLNRSRGQPVQLSPLVVKLLRLAKALIRASGGSFNCTVGGTLERLGVLPPPGNSAEIDIGRADDIAILDRQTACLRRPVHVTLDGIAKGFAVDRAIDVLRDCGIGAGWVNAGGDLRVTGSIALPLVFREKNGFSVAGGVSDCAVATSVTADSTDECFPGRIVATDDTALQQGSWTVMAREAWRADALTKVAALATGDQRAAMVERLGGRLIDARAAA